LAVAYSSRGVAKAAKGDPAGAIADPGKAFELDPRLGNSFTEALKNGKATKPATTPKP
jgi:hypothetical protein